MVQVLVGGQHTVKLALVGLGVGIGRSIVAGWVEEVSQHTSSRSGGHGNAGRNRMEFPTDGAAVCKHIAQRDDFKSVGKPRIVSAINLLMGNLFCKAAQYELPYLRSRNGPEGIEKPLFIRR